MSFWNPTTWWGKGLLWGSGLGEDKWLYDHTIKHPDKVTEEGDSVASDQKPFDLNGAKLTPKAISAEDYRIGQNLFDAWKGSGERTAPTATPNVIDANTLAAARGSQTRNIQDLENTARGFTKSSAEIQGENATARNVANQYALAAALGGRNPNASLRQASNAAAGLQAQNTADAMGLRAQEQAAARTALGNAISSQRTQDITGATSQAQLDNSTALANLKANLDMTNLDDARKKALLDQALESMQASGNVAVGKLNADVTQRGQDVQQNMQLTKSLGESLPLLSDRREKKNIHSADGDIGDFLNKMHGYIFNYKDSENGSGERVGVMAQDVARSRIGKDIVTPRNDGRLIIDVPNALGASLAALTNINKRLKKIEAD